MPEEDRRGPPIVLAAADRLGAALGFAAEKPPSRSVTLPETKPMPVLNPVGHTIGCAQGAVTPALSNGVLLTLLQSMGGPPPPAQMAMVFGMNCAFVYSYFVVQCPMEALHGKQSLLHNGIAGSAMGYLGVQSGKLGMFNLEYTFMMNRIPLPIGGAMVYGALAAALGALGGKRL